MGYMGLRLTEVERKKRDKEIIRLRNTFSLTQLAIAKRFGLCQWTVSRILKGK